MSVLVPRADWEASACDERPCFAPIRRAAARFHGFAEWPTVDELSRMLEGLPVRFEEQKPRGRRRRKTPIDVRGLYDGRIETEGVVPSRARSWHDFFNALVWASFPRAKKTLHTRQFRALAKRHEAPVLRLPGSRTREQDALAMLDEGGLLLVATRAIAPEAHDAVRTCNLHAITALAHRGAITPMIFGHAIYEHLVSSDAPVRALAVVLVRGEDSEASVDDALAAWLEDEANLKEPPPWPAVPIDEALFEATREVSRRVWP